VPCGPRVCRATNWRIPTLMSAAPGFNALATGLMKQTFKNKGVASIPELRAVCTEGGVNMIACTLTLDGFVFKKDDFIAEANFGGAATFLEYAKDADVHLFI